MSEKKNKDNFKKSTLVEDIKLSPNFEYEEDIVDDAECTFALNDSFEAFISVKDEKPYLVYQNKNNYNLEVFKILKNKYKIVTSIEGHSTKITCLKYYYNENKNIEYLISSDYGGNIIVTNITDDYKKKYIKIPKYEDGQISCCLMIFNIYNKEKLDIKNGLVLVSNKNSLGEGNLPTRLYILNENGLFSYYTDLASSSNNTSYMIYWFNKRLKKDYIIDIGHLKISVINLVESDLYATFTTHLNTWHHCGFVYCDEENKTDLLFFTSIKSIVFVIDLYSRQIIKTIKTSGKIERLYNIIQWNSNYLLVSNATAPDIKVIDIKEKKCVGNIFIEQYEDDFRCIRKIKHPKFGYCLMTGGDDYSIKLYKLKNI